MKTLLFFLLFAAVSIYSQSDLPRNLTGNHINYDIQRGITITTNPVPVNPGYVSEKTTPVYDNPDSIASTIRYGYSEPVSIGTYCAEAGNGLKSIVGWYLNNERVSAYGNTNSTPLWEFPEVPQTPLYYNYVGVSTNVSNVADAFYQHIYSLDGTNGNTTWSFDITTLFPDTLSAGPIVITSTGNFIVATLNGHTQTDSSRVVGFTTGSNTPVWTKKIGPTGTIGSQFQGAKISGNDSLVIVNTYITAYVIRTYTGQIMYSGTVNPLSNNGTQNQQGISGNGNIIATTNFQGYVRVLQWNGSTYNLLWQHQEPPGTFYNWMTAVDVSNDGSMVAIGTLNFVSSSNYDGKIKLFSVAGGSTPLWTSSGDSDEVNSVAFSKNGRFLCSASWGSYYTHSAYNLKVFKTSHITNIPWFKANSAGSFFCSSISDDGQTVIGTGKGVHARAFGSGGMLYNVLIDTSENPVGIINQNTVPISYSISQNYPNPFNPSTQINYDIPKDGIVKITVFDVLGREVSTVVNKFQKGGSYSVSFDGTNLTSGIYFYKIESQGFTETKKMMLIK